MEDNNRKIYPADDSQPYQGGVNVSDPNGTQTNQTGSWQQPYSSNYPYYSQQPYNYPGANGWGAADGGANPTNTAPVTAKKSGGAGLAGVIGALILIVLVGLLAFFLISNNKGVTSGTATPGVVGSSTTAAATTAAATAPAVNTAASAPVNQTSGSSAATGVLDVRQVAQQVRPAVVQITSQQTVDTTNPFFGSGSSGQIATGIGSGVIYDKAGYILTNNHVVEGANSLLVTLPDGRSFDGKVVGTDPLTDLAVVQIDPKGATLPVAQLGDSSQLQVGDGLVAIGNALGLPGGPTVTSGVVSALNRSVTEPGSQSTTPTNPFGGSRGGATAATTAGPQLYGLIQTDAAINPGNSGGALVNAQGQVVGINTLVAGQAEPGVQAQGIGFAISINQAKDVANQLVTNGKVSHPFMGISYQPLTAALANRLGLNASIKNGAVLGQVVSGSPAAQAGLKANDVIVSIDGKQLTDESTLGEVLNSHKVGDKVTLQVITPNGNGGNSQPRTVQVTLGERPAGQ
jgi:S1-C subfamily serine protease